MMLSTFFLETEHEGEGEAEYVPRRVRPRAAESKRPAHRDVTDAWEPSCPLPGVTADLGFHFTEAEKRAIRRGCEGAAKFMKSYGKGRAPISVDRRHYYCDFLAVPVPGKSETAKEEDHVEEVQDNVKAL